MTTHPTEHRSAPVRPYLSLTIVLLGAFMLLIDVTIVSVALPSIARDLGASYADLQLVGSVYTLTFACSLITASRLGDLYGRRRVFLLALTAFVLASAACGAAPDATSLEIARGVQGLAAGVMSAQTIAFIATLFPPERRGAAFGLYGGVIGLATICGPVLGGALIQWNPGNLGWRSVFYVNVPIGLLTLLLGIAKLAPVPAAGGRRRLDLPGAVWSALGLFLVVYPLVEGRQRGWPGTFKVMLAAAVPVIALFLVYEWWQERRDADPLIRLGVFADRAFAVGAVSTVVFFGALVSFFFTLSLTLQLGYGYTALHAGLLTLPFAAGSAIGSAVSEVFARRLGRGVLVLGTALLVVATLGLARLLGRDAVPWWLVEVVLAAGGAGLGLYVAPQQTIILARTSPQHIGSASGILPTLQQVGSSLGLALLGVLFFAQLGVQADHALRDAKSALTGTIAAQVGRPAADGVMARFVACTRDRFDSVDPTQTPASCRADNAPVLPPTARDALASAALQARTVAFREAERRSLWALAGAFGFVLLLSLLLPPAPQRSGGPGRTRQPGSADALPARSGSWAPG